MNMLNKFISSRKHDPFLIDAQSGRTWTYGAFIRASYSLALRLENLGIKHGDRVAGVLKNCPEYPFVYFACLLSGAVAVPVNLAHSEGDREYILSVAKPSLIICSRDTLRYIPHSIKQNKPLLCLGDDHSCCAQSWTISEESMEECSFKGICFEQLFTLTFTSGTTGRPKGIFHTVGTLFSNAEAFSNAMQVKKDDRFYHVLPMAYMAGILNNLLCPFVAGASVVVDRGFDSLMAFNFWETPSKFQVNIMWLVPSILKILLKLNRGEEGIDYVREHMKFICVGTAPLSHETKVEFEDRYGVSLLPSYGLSEHLIITIARIGDKAFQGSSGSALSGVDISIVDEVGQALSPGSLGEIFVKTPSYMVGYLDPKTSLPVPEDRSASFATGDIGFIDEHGHLSITDRKKDLIIRGGINISPKKIEEVLTMHDSVVEAAVVGAPDINAGEIVAAVLKLTTESNLEDIKADLSNLCKIHLERAAWPEYYTSVDEFLTSSTGKLSKKDLVCLVASRRSSEA